MRDAFLVVCLNPTMQRTFRLARLEPGQVNRVRSHRLDLSGKGVNVTRVLAQLGERAVHLTQSGGEHLETFLRLAAEDDLDVAHVEAPIELRTCYTLIDDEAGLITEIVEPGWPASPGLEERVRERYVDLLRGAHTVIISGSKAPGFGDELYPDMVREAREAGVRVVIDFRGSDLVRSLPHRPSVVKINVSEFSATFLDARIPEETAAEAMPAGLGERMVSLEREYGMHLVLTNGSRPALFVADGRVAQVPVRAVRPVNTIGSGDAATAGIAAGLARGASIREAIELGLECARKNVLLERPGVIR